MSEKIKTIKTTAEPIKYVWGLLCSMSSTDMERKNISLFNVIEQFNLPSELFKTNAPIIHPHELIIFWKRTLDVGIAGDAIVCDLKIRTIDPTGKDIQEFLTPLTFPGGMKRLRAMVRFERLVISCPGNYAHEINVKFSGSDNFVKAGEVPFEILEIK